MKGNKIDNLDKCLKSLKRRFHKVGSSKIDGAAWIASGLQDAYYIVLKYRNRK